MYHLFFLEIVFKMVVCTYNRSWFSDIYGSWKSPEFWLCHYSGNYGWLGDRQSIWLV